MPSPRIIISGGGTGGHIFPAIAIADACKRMRPDAEFLFVGALGRMEMERVPKAGYRIEGLWISGLQRKLTLQNLSFPVKVLSSLVKARSIVRMFKPDVAVGVGGYASGPLLRAASAAGVPCIIQEQNSFPGITNKILARKARKICVAYEGMERWFASEKIVLTGNPVREAVTAIAGKRPEALRHFGLEQDKPVLLVVGGSLGARTINESIAAGLQAIAQAGVQLVWQTGQGFAHRADELVAAYRKQGIASRPFIDRMDLAYAAADLVVSRAGAMSIAEICLTAKPSILVPSPNVAEDHQTKNARALSDRGAAVLVSDQNASKELVTKALELMEQRGLRESIAREAAAMAHPKAAEAIATQVLHLCKAL